jgi:hypothetical protein
MQTSDPHSEIIVVSGLPRSGTSLMMKMLAAGGLPLLVDGLREPDDDNPEGYFELERVKALVTGDDAWLAEARGRAVKVISSLLKFLPGTYSYRVILMQRRMSEVLASQRRMLKRRGEPVDTLSDEKLAVISVRHLQQVQVWLAAQPNITVLPVDYNVLVADPVQYTTLVNTFLDGYLNVSAMIATVNPQLYRNRSAGDSNGGVVIARDRVG